MSSWTISTQAAGQRLDLFLVEQGVGSSRSAVQKMIRTGNVTVNEKMATVHRFLKAGDVVSIGNRIHEGSNAPALLATPLALRGGANSPTIIADTDSWLVLDKPTGLLVHADRASTEPTLVDWLVERYPGIAKVGEDPVRPGIVHRLDREVSGLMVIAKTQDAYENLTRQFRARLTKKTYLALVHGRLDKDEGDIKFRIARSSSHARMAARPAHEEQGKAAWTHYRVLERWHGATLLQLEILSGRTHQIRAHLHALGKPVIGDTLYSLKKTDRNVAASRLMLQSVGLEFNDPETGERRIFNLKPDSAFAILLKKFRASPLS